jgi:hypothetical protein
MPGSSTGSRIDLLKGGAAKTVEKNEKRINMVVTTIFFKLNTLL